jgi:hypothetical protein
MPGVGPHRFYFVDKAPWIFGVLVALLFVNTTAGLVALPMLEHFRSRLIHSRPAEWYDSRFIAIQFILLALIGLVFVIYRRNVRYEYRGMKRK